MAEDLTARIDRLESLDEIRQLVAKYALSLDMRDLDAHVNLFAPDIRVSRDKVGRRHLRRWLDDTLRLQFTGTPRCQVPSVRPAESCTVQPWLVSKLSSTT